MKQIKTQQRDVMRFSESEISEIESFIDDLVIRFDEHIQNNLWQDFDKYNHVMFFMGNAEKCYKKISFNKLRNEINISIISKMIVDRFKSNGWKLKYDGNRYDIISYIHKFPKDMVVSISVDIDYKIYRPTLLERFKKIHRMGKIDKSSNKDEFEFFCEHVKVQVDNGKICRVKKDTGVEIGFGSLGNSMVNVIDENEIETLTFNKQ